MGMWKWHTCLSRAWGINWSLTAYFAILILCLDTRLTYRGWWCCSAFTKSKASLSCHLLTPALSYWVRSSFSYRMCVCFSVGQNWQKGFLRTLLGQRLRPLLLRLEMVSLPLSFGLSEREGTESSWSWVSRCTALLLLELVTFVHSGDSFSRCLARSQMSKVSFCASLYCCGRRQIGPVAC